MPLTKVRKPFAVGAPEPDRGRGAGKRAEDSRVAVIEDGIDKIHNGTTRHILKKPSLDKVVSEFAGQARDTAEDDSEAKQTAKRSVFDPRRDAVEHKIEQ